MKKRCVTAVLTGLLLAFAMSSCHRNYKVNYAHVAEDSLKNAIDSADAVLEAQEAAQAEKEAQAAVEEDMDEETLFEVPDIPGDVTASQIMNRANKKVARDAEKLYSGQEIE